CISTSLKDPCVSKVKGKYPLVVYMHGCSGPNSHYVDLFRNLGYPVIAVNSLARPRAAVCPTGRDTVMLRFEEVKLVLERTAGWDWVDRSRLVLAGFSEGGITAAKYHGNEFKARVIFGFTCTSD